VLLSGFVLMPVLGLRNAFALLAFALCATALGYAGLRGQRLASACSGLAAIAAVVVFSVGNEGWRVVLSSGAFRNRSTVYDPTIMQQRNQLIKIVYYKDAPDATVSVERSVKSGEYFLRVNGKTDASSHGDLSTQMLLGHLGLMARPEAKDVFVLGLGSGITGGAVLAHPVQSLIVAENCKPVIEAAKIFQPFNYDMLSDARTRIVPEDGRTILKLSPKQYDVIISEPSNPWTAGIGSVFSREYYKLAASKLAPGGVMVQWFHVYEMHDGIVAMVLRTFSEVFPHVEIWDAHGGDIILMGGKEPWTSNVDSWRRAYERALVRQQLEMIGLGMPEQLLARQLASQRTAFAIAGDGPVQSDYFPMLEYEAPKAFFIGKEASLLRNYDERTVQAALLPDAKQQVLASLEDARLRAAFFSGFQSVNSDLTKILSARLNTNATMNLSSNIPSVFQRASHSRAPETIRSLGDQFQAAIPQLEGPDTRQRAVLRLRELIDYAQKNGIPSALYAAQAARQLLACADYAGARVFLEIGFAADKNEPQLNYIARILEREQSRSLASAK
jgi:spermidine synthase